VFTVTNTGNTTLTGVTITDPLATVVGGPIATLAPGATDNSTFTAIYTLTQADIDAGTFTNVATAHGTPPTGPPVTGTDDDTQLLPAASSISMTKTGTIHKDVVAPNGIANAGDQITYVFTVTNTGNTTLTNVTITDPQATVAGGPIASLAPGATDNSTFTATYTLTQADINAGTFTNVATAHGTPPSGPAVTGSDDDTQNYLVCPEITVQPAPSTICAGGTASFVITVAEGSNPVNYQWQVSSTGCLSGFANIPGATNATFTTGPLGATSYFKCLVIPQNQHCTTIESSCTMVTVNPPGQVNQPANQVVCNGSTVSAAFTTTNVGGATTYAWTNNSPGIGLGANGNGNILPFTAVNFSTAPVVALITVTPTYTNDGVSCTGSAKTFTITVNPSGQVNQPAGQVVCNGSQTSVVTFTTNNFPGTTTYTWTNNNTNTGIPSGGTGNVPSYSVVNNGNLPAVSILTVTPYYTNAGVTCDGTAMNFTIVVNPSGQVIQPAGQVVCNGAFTNVVNFSTINIIGTTTYTWSNSNTTIGLSAGGSGSVPAFAGTNTGAGPVTALITVTPHFTYAGTTCDGVAATFTITVNPSAQVNDMADQTVCNGEVSPAIVLTSGNSGGSTVFTWTNSNPAIGLGASGSGNIPSFVAVNNGNAPVVANITVTPHYTSAGVTCEGQSKTFHITVNPTGQVNQPADVVACNGSLTSGVIFTTVNDLGTTTYTWTNNNPGIGLPPAGFGDLPMFIAVNNFPVPAFATITVTPHFDFAGATCDGTPKTFTITVNSSGQVNDPADQVVCNEGLTTPVVFSSVNIPGTTFYSWTNDNPGVGLAPSGAGDIPAFTAFNASNIPVVATITVTPHYSYAGTMCDGPSQSFTVTVNPSAQVNQPAGQAVCNGSFTSAVNFTTINGSGSTSYSWTNSNPAIGLAPAGNGNIPAFIAVNNAPFPVNAFIDVTPHYTYGGVTCDGAAQTFVITVNPSAQVNQPANQVVCNGSPASDVIFTSDNSGGITTYTWNNSDVSIGLPASGFGNIPAFFAVNNGNAPVVAIITVMPHFTNGSQTCDGPVSTFTITVNPTAQVNTPGNQVLCNGSLTSEVEFTTNNLGGNNVYTWTNSDTSIGLAASGSGSIPSFVAANSGIAPVVAVITVTPHYINDGVSCTGSSVSFTVTVNPSGQVNDPSASSQVVCNGSLTAPVNFTTINLGGTSTFTWTNNNPSIGLGASGSGNIPSFAAVNAGSIPVVATVTVTPHYTNAGVTCDGPSMSFTYTVNPPAHMEAPASQVVCNGSLTQPVNFAPGAGPVVNTFTWTNSNTAIGLAASGIGNIPSFFATNGGTSPAIAVITVTPHTTGGGVTCDGPPVTFTITVNPSGQVNATGNQSVCNGSLTSPVNFTTVNTGGITTYSWTNSNTTIGLASSGFGNISAFTAINNGLSQVVATITVTPHFTFGGQTCDGVSQSFSITVSPKPILVTNAQTACSPSRVDLTAPGVTAGSNLFGATLSYWLNAAATIPMPNPTTANTGTYYIKATSLLGCYDIQPVTVIINPLPTVFNGVGSGSYCSGGPGIVVGISGSQIGVNYTLWIGLTPVSGILPGTGLPLSFGLQTLPGYYWVLAENTTTHCINRMFDCVYISVEPLLPVSVAITASVNPVVAGLPVTFNATPNNEGSTPSYQWKVNGFNMGANQPVFTYVPVNGDVVSCVLTSSLSCTSGNPAVSNLVVMQVNGVAGNSTATGVVANGDTKCYNALQTIIVAGGGTTFTVQNGGSATMIAGQNIRYMPGTTVQPGGYMHGYITTTSQFCGQQAPALPTVATGGDEQPALSMENPTFTIYPNPTSGNFTLEQKGENMKEDVKVEIFSMQGEKVLTGALTGERKHEFSVSGFAPGLYFVKVVAGDFVTTIKLIKTR
jgi:hypothetical protein